MRKIFILFMMCAMGASLWALPTAVKNRAFFEGITYSWPYNADPSAQQQSNLGEIATDPDQIIAMLREVYSNPTIPGNYARGYSAEGVNEGTWQNGTATGNYPVAYPAVGKLIDNDGAIGYSDSYGWDLPGAFYKVNKESRTVTFDASVEADCVPYVSGQRTFSITKDGITLTMGDLHYVVSGTTKYYKSGSKVNINVKSEERLEIIRVDVVCRNSSNAGYIQFVTPDGTYFKTEGSTKVWKGWSSEVEMKNPSNAVEVTKVIVTYQVVGTNNYFSNNDVHQLQDETVVFDSSKDKYSATSATKGNFVISYFPSLSASNGYYQITYGGHGDFKTIEGYLMDFVKFTFLDSSHGANNIIKIEYKDLNGNTITLRSTTSPSINDFVDSNNDFIWNIPTTYLSIYAKTSPNNTNSNIRVTKIEASYKYIYDDFYFANNTYTPDEEGNTVLLVEVKDGFDVVNDPINVSDYTSLREMIGKCIKSVRVLTDAKRVGASTDAGTLFKIDANKLNRFFLIGKGQLRWFNNDYTKVSDGVERFQVNYSDYLPYYYGAQYHDNEAIGSINQVLFNHMFEQFSPSNATNGTAATDLYRDLVQMKSFSVIHDCVDIISASDVGHEFNMYGKESLSEDCQDVRDMMFFVPDYRMLAHNGINNTGVRDPSKAQKYINYNPDHAPTLGLYVIKLDEITDAKRVKVEGEDAYDIDLTWTSNLLDFLPGEQGVYTLYRVTNVNGVETYTPVLDGNGQQVTITTDNADDLHYTDRVAQLPNEGQTITYAVRGRDSGEFLSLQMSNKESVYIPGIDVSEDLNLKLKADYYSRFDPQTECNNYSNLVTMGSKVSNISASDLEAGTLTFTRSYTDAEGVHNDVIATGTAAGGTMTVVMQNQAFFKYGYNSNGTATEASPNPTFTKAYAVSGDGVQFTGDFKFYDNFTASVADNTHPSEYVYQVEFTYGDKYAKSNTMSVYVHKTAMAMEPEGGRAVSRDDVDGDVTRSLPANGTVDFDIDVKYSSKKEILRYDAYRWPEGANRYIIEPSSPTTAEQDVPPTGIAGNQGDRYTVAMNADSFLYTGETTTLGDEQTATQAHFVDNYVSTAAGIYTYAPVIEVFPPNESRSDYNTYGAPLQQAATGTITASERTSFDQAGNSQNTFPQKSVYTWDDNGTLCAYYTFLLNLDADIPEGYDLYKVRAWRQMDTDYQHEELSDRRFRMGEDVLFAEYSYPFYTKSDNATWPIGAGEPMQPVSSQGGKVVGEMAGTFGAIDVTTANGGQGIDIPITFVVRAYYTREANMTDLRPENAGGAPRRLGATSEADGKYYVLEKVVETTLKGTGENQIVTALTDAVADVREVADVTYFNVTGMASKRPFAGVNVVVTRYTDGTTSSRRMLNR